MVLLVPRDVQGGGRDLLGVRRRSLGRRSMPVHLLHGAAATLRRVPGEALSHDRGGGAELRWARAVRGPCESVGRDLAEGARKAIRHWGLLGPFLPAERTEAKGRAELHLGRPQGAFQISRNAKGCRMLLRRRVFYEIIDLLTIS